LQSGERGSFPSITAVLAPAGAVSHPKDTKIEAKPKGKNK